MDIKVACYNFANKYRKNKLIFNLLKPIWLKFVNRDSNRQLKIFHKNGLEVIKHLASICAENNLTYWLDFGTLLGAVREKGFIAYDNDIDIGVKFEDKEAFQNAITSGGFKIAREFLIRDANKVVGIEQTYHYKGVLVDIFYYIFHTPTTRVLYTFTPINDDYSLSNKAEIKKTVVPFFPVKSYRFKDIEVMIPNNEDEYLQFHYGKNYMTPDPNYRSSDIVKTIEYIPREEKIADFIQHRRLYS